MARAVERGELRPAQHRAATVHPAAVMAGSGGGGLGPAAVVILAGQSTQDVLQAVDAEAGGGQGYVLDRVETVEPPENPLPTPSAGAAAPSGLFLLSGRPSSPSARGMIRTPRSSDTWSGSNRPRPGAA